MKGRYISFFCLLILIFALSCGSEPEETEIIPAATRDRFAEQLIDINTVADLQQLTNRDRDYIAYFNPEGNRIYFTRLVEVKESDNDSMPDENIEQYYSMDYKTGQLYIVEQMPQQHNPGFLPPESLPARLDEIPKYGLKADSILYFVSANKVITSRNIIYQVIDDSLTQLTFGKKSSLLQRVSPDGRYIAFLYDQDESILVVYDNESGKFYAVPENPNKPQQIEYGVSFSPDSKYMLFMRSGDLFEKGDMPYGNIWIAEFKK